MQTVSRLITYFEPSHYILSITLERKERTFRGTVDIHGIVKNVNEIRLHAKDLTIESILIDGKQAVYSVHGDELVITHPDLTLKKHLVTISYHGKITDGMHGLYPCYFEYDGAKKELLATQFESHHAREVFPCVDEPEAKATFDLTLVTEQNITVLGNMPVKIQRAENDSMVTIFETTPRMSTYLLAWVVGELHRKTAKTKAGVEVSMWATFAQPASSLDFALKTAVDTIEFFNEYFGVPYPLPKADHVALPDFSSGAMENWGLITYRERALLVDPETTSINTRHYVAMVIAHELSHQWFGNLVTMKWWNNLWLNESFAMLMEYIAVDALYPEWNIWLDFSTTEATLALRRDSIDGVQAVQTEVHHPDEIATLFDGAIVYAKGARLLRMLHTYIGDTAFRKGLQAYFAAHAYQNTEASDLWHALSKTSGKDIAVLMNTWISQPGYPVVSVKKHARGIKLAQAQFFVGKHAPTKKRWQIPLNASLPIFPTLFAVKETIVPTTQIPYLNDGDSAHFITHYDDDAITEILSTLSSRSSLDRLQLLHEQILLTRGDIVPATRLINFLWAYKHETSEPVWDIMRLAFHELKKFADDDKIAKLALQQFGVALAKEHYHRLGWEPHANESESDAKLRATILSLMLYGRDPYAVNQALHIQQTQSFEQINPEIRPLILSTAIRHAKSPALFNEFLEAYGKTTLPELQSDIKFGLTSTENAKQIRQLLELLKNTAIIRRQDVPGWFLALLSNNESRNMTWHWLLDNWGWIIDNFKGDKSFDTFPRISGSILANRAQLQEFTTFFTPIMKQEPALKRIINIASNEIEARVEMIEKNITGVKAALEQLNKRP